MTPELNAERPNWQARAACRHIDVAHLDWFSDHPAQQAAAIRICNTCPVRDECLHAAIVAGDRFGIFGGVTARDRARIRKQLIMDGTLEASRNQQRCGTEAGYWRHHRRGETCDACRVAHNVAEKNRKLARKAKAEQ